MVAVLEGSTFCICDELGDIDEGVDGFFVDDMRYLSRFSVTVNGASPLLLTSGRPENFSAAFYLRNPVAGGLPADALMLVRRRFVVGASLEDQLVVSNIAERPLRFEIALTLAADFADIITVKDHDFSPGRAPEAVPLPPPRSCEWSEDGKEAHLEDDEGTATQLVLSQRGETSAEGSVYEVSLEPGSRWELYVRASPAPKPTRPVPRGADEQFRDDVTAARESLEAWSLRMPQVFASWEPVAQTFHRSVADLAALRMRGQAGGGRLPAAGAPWFMTVFGRDTIVTCLQTMLLGPELASAALETLVALQATEDDPSIDAEPGKIIHELRQGKAARRWFARYYGAVDSTPLFLILLSELWRWTDDWALANRFRPSALAALGWIDAYGDRDGDGFVEYGRRTPRGLDNQCWKDSGDSQRFRDGRVAEAPIAPCEVQGYVYDGKRRIAEMARHAWRDAELADRLEREADDLAVRFDEAYWMEDRKCYALALDGAKRQVDSVTSNVGHLLWSGIVKPERRGHVVDHLLGPGLWSGWGVRTMSTNDRAYSPLAYHNGTVWPHDNSLICAGLARSGCWPEAQRVARSMLEAARSFSWELPEVFSGLPRNDAPFPVPYPSSARPQAWAAGTPILLLQTLLGLRPARARQTLDTVVDFELPSWAGELGLTGIRAFDARWQVRLEHGQVSVDRI